MTQHYVRSASRVSQVLQFAGNETVQETESHMLD